MLLGSTTPRLWTPPLRELTPETSYGYDAIAFSGQVLRMPVDPWQEWALIHAGELLPDGRPRFRRLLILVARQNGKTHLCVVLALYWLFVELVDLVLGTSTKLEYAQESWSKAVRLARAVPELDAQIPKRGGVRKVNGDVVLTTTADARYKIAASNEEGGRSLTVHRLIMDELRQHNSWDAYNACYPAMRAVRSGQAVAISNAGSARSVVLNQLRQDAIGYLSTGAGDYRLGLFEYSSADGASPTDPSALAAANPNMNRAHGPALEELLAEGAAALASGDPEALSGFRTESMCQYVKVLAPAIDPTGWAACRLPGTLDGVRDRLGACVDVSLDGSHATLTVAAELPDGRVRVEPVAAWPGVHTMLAELPALLARIRPRAFGWLPGGPAAAAAAKLAVDRHGHRRRWYPRGVNVEEIREDAAAICMGFSALVTSGQLVHSGDPLLDEQVSWTEQLPVGDRWRFSRKGLAPCDAVYSAAGAVHLARSMTPGPGRQRVVVAADIPADRPAPVPYSEREVVAPPDDQP